MCTRPRWKRTEYYIVEAARSLGKQARRIILSGSGIEKGDVEIDGERYEVKSRARVPAVREVASWVEKAEAQGLAGVILACSRKLVVIRRCKGVHNRVKTVKEALGGGMLVTPYGAYEFIPLQVYLRGRVSNGGD